MNKQGLSAGKAFLGGFLFGGVGAIVGASMGKKMTRWSCPQCGFSNDYDYSAFDESSIFSRNQIAANQRRLEMISQTTPINVEEVPAIPAEISNNVIDKSEEVEKEKEEQSQNEYSGKDLLLQALRDSNSNFDKETINSIIALINKSQDKAEDNSSITETVNEKIPETNNITARSETKSISKKELMREIVNSKFDTEAVKNILAHSDVDINTRDINGRTILMAMAAKSPNPEIIDVVINEGANPSMKDNYGLTALDYAKKFHMSDNAAALEKYLN